MHAPSSTLSSVSQAHCQSPLLARAAVTRRSSWRHSLCQLEAESMEIRGEVMRRDFHFPNALHSVCVCVCFYLNFFLQCITHSRRRPKHQPSLLRSAVPFFFFFFFHFRSKDEKGAEQCSDDVRPGRIEQRCGLAAGYASLSGIKRTGKRAATSLQILRSQSRRTEGLAWVWVPLPIQHELRSTGRADATWRSPLYSAPLCVPV